MTTEQLNVENTLKNLRIGKWNVGQQTGLFKYDKKTYERERSELALDLMANIGRDDPMDAGMDVGELEDIEREEGVLEMQGEEMDFTMFGEEYTEGAYYEEDRDDEDGGY